MSLRQLNSLGKEGPRRDPGVGLGERRVPAWKPDEGAVSGGRWAEGAEVREAD